MLTPQKKPTAFLHPDRKPSAEATLLAASQGKACPLVVTPCFNTTCCLWAHDLCRLVRSTNLLHECSHHTCLCLCDHPPCLQIGTVRRMRGGSPMKMCAWVMTESTPTTVVMTIHATSPHVASWMISTLLMLASVPVLIGGRLSARPMVLSAQPMARTARPAVQPTSPTQTWGRHVLRPGRAGSFNKQQKVHPHPAMTPLLPATATMTTNTLAAMSLDTLMLFGKPLIWLKGHKGGTHDVDCYDPSLFCTEQ